MATARQDRHPFGPSFALSHTRAPNMDKFQRDRRAIMAANQNVAARVSENADQLRGQGGGVSRDLGAFGPPGGGPTSFDRLPPPREAALSNPAPRTITGPPTQRTTTAPQTKARRRNTGPLLGTR